MVKYGLAGAMVLVAFLLCACPNAPKPEPDPPSTPSIHLSYSIDGGAAITYDKGPSLGGAKNFSISTSGEPFVTIFGTTSKKLFVYAAKSVAEFEAAPPEDFIEIFISGTEPFSGSYASAIITLQVGNEQYSALSVITLVLDQSIDSTGSIGTTVTGSFSGTISADGGTTTKAISGDFRIVYQTATWNIT